MPVMTFSRQQAADAVAAAQAERDAIQENLLDLDGSFGKRLLAGAALTGVSKQRWDTAAAALATLWDMFNDYSAVVDRAAQLAAGRLGQKELTEIAGLLTGPAVDVSRGPAPLARRDLADTGHDKLTLATARARMRSTFSTVTDVVTAAEQAWNDMATRLDAIAADLANAGPAGDEALAGEVTAVRTELDRLRAALNADPLGCDAAAADRLAGRARAAAARTAELAALRDGAARRIAAAKAAATQARAAQADAQAAWQRAAAKISAVPLVPACDDQSARVAGLDGLLAAGRLGQLSAELEVIERELQLVMKKCLESERTSVSLLSQRDELRGLMDAYKAKAARLGAAEDPGLARLYGQARDLLWTAPCDLVAAAAAVTSYQQAVLGIGAR
jgi:hypothetical protein